MTNKTKSPEAFRTIGETVTEIGEEAHVLRFWEKQFKELQPMKNGGGRRFYRPENIELLKAIRYFLRNQGYKIEGVQKLLKQHGEDGFIRLAKKQPTENNEISNVHNQNQDQQQLINIQQGLQKLRSQLLEIVKD